MVPIRQGRSTFHSIEKGSAIEKLINRRCGEFQNRGERRDNQGEGCWVAGMDRIRVHPLECTPRYDSRKTALHYDDHQDNEGAKIDTNRTAKSIQIAASKKITRPILSPPWAFSPGWTQINV